MDKSLEELQADNERLQAEINSLRHERDDDQMGGMSAQMGAGLLAGILGLVIIIEALMSVLGKQPVIKGLLAWLILGGGCLYLLGFFVVLVMDRGRGITIEGKGSPLGGEGKINIPPK